jgi:hypothetical protein
MSEPLATAPRCAAHEDEPAITACGACGRRLCDACFAYVARTTTSASPRCARCALVAARGAGATYRVLGFVVSTLGMLLGGAFAYARHTRGAPSGLGVAVGAGLVASLAGFLLSHTPKRDADSPVRAREEGDVPPSVREATRGAHPYRAGLARVTVRAVPMLSGRGTAGAVLVALFACLVALPYVLRLPRWIELELGLGLFWLSFAALLTTLLFRGYGVRDDHALVLPFAGDGASSTRPKKGGGGSWDLGGLDFGVDGEGCVAVLVVLVAAIVALFATWLLVELVLPLLFLVAYELIVRGVQRVGRDRHDCAGQLGRSLGWGALFATAYVAPFVGLVWLAQRLLGG